MTGYREQARQIGMIVPDFDAALAYWTEVMGAGPFFVTRKVKFDNFRYRGESAPSPTVSLAFGQLDTMQVEIIAQHDDLPSGYRDYLGSGKQGPQHMAHWFASHEDYDRAYRQLLDLGYTVRQQGGGMARFSYFSAGEGQYPEIELAEALLPELDGWADRIKAASVDWDGSAPLRNPDGTIEASA